MDSSNHAQPNLSLPLTDVPILLQEEENLSRNEKSTASLMNNDEKKQDRETDEDSFFDSDEDDETNQTTSTQKQNFLQRFWHEKIYKQKHLIFLYVSLSLTAIGDRMWQFAVPLSLTYVYQASLLPVAVFQAVGLLACTLLGNVIGHLVDRLPRLVTVLISYAVQNFMVASSAATILVIILFEKQNQVAGTYPFSNWFFFVVFLVSTLLNAVASVTSMIGSIAVQRDWSVVISSYHNIKLEDLNSNIRRIDLFCDIAAPLLFSTLLTFASPLVSILFVSIWNIISFFPEFLFLLAVYRVTPPLSVKLIDFQKSEPQIEKQETEDVEEIGTLLQKTARFLFSGWLAYLRQKILLASFAYVLLYITVLHHGAILLAYLSTSQFKEQSFAVGIFRALAALGGFIATIVSPLTIRGLGTVFGGLAGILFQLGCLTIGGVFFALYEFHVLPIYGVYIFLIFIIFSRFGLWSFDLAQTQIMQQEIDETERGLVNSMEKGLTKFAELIILILTSILSDPKQFIYLIIISYCCVFLAAFLYSSFVLKLVVTGKRKAFENQVLSSIEATMKVQAEKLKYYRKKKVHHHHHNHHSHEQEEEQASNRNNELEISKVENHATIVSEQLQVRSSHQETHQVGDAIETVDDL